MDISKRYKFAKKIIEEPVATIMKVYHNLDVVEFKPQAFSSEVTKADKEAEKILRALIEREFPDDGIIGEEFGTKKSKNGFSWTLDPIDGTRSFCRKVPFFGTMIGGIYQNKIEFGVINFPVLNELFCAKIGEGCFLNNKKIEIKNNVTNLSEALFSFSGKEYFETSGHLKIFEKLEKSTAFSRSWGDCYGYSLLAQGKFEIMVDSILNIWDLIPLYCICLEAGAHVMDINGGEVTVKSTSFVGVVPQLKDSVRSLLAE